MLQLPPTTWIHGIRDSCSQSFWADTAIAVLSGQYATIVRRKETAQAEAQLHFEPSWYWYIGRSDAAFGHGVFAMADRDDVEWEPNDRGICRFDTGGLWYGKIKTTQPLRMPDDARSVVAMHDMSLAGWRERFLKFLSIAYPSFREYVEGHPPTIPCEPVVLANPPNSPRAWTWEARVPIRCVQHHVLLIRFFCTESDHDWLCHCIINNDDLERSEKHRLISLLLDVTRTHRCADDSRPASIALEQLLTP